MGKVYWKDFTTIEMERFQKEDLQQQEWEGYVKLPYNNRNEEGLMKGP